MPNLNVPTSTTITFDEHITKVSWLGWTMQGDTQIYEATTSGQAINWFYPDDGSYYVITFTITLDNNYILNDVNVNGMSGEIPIKNKTNNTFEINLRDDNGTYDPSTITLTSKLEVTSDTKPVYKFINNAWVKQDAFQFTNGSWVRISTATTSLATPVISLADDILKIQNVANATSYDVYVDGVLKKNIPVGGAVGHKLTFSDISSVKVNNVAVSSPYTLQNGDTIVIFQSANQIGRDYYTPNVSVNGTNYNGNSSPITLDLANTDISVDFAGYDSHVDLDEINLKITINYTEGESTYSVSCSSYADK